MAFEGTRQGMAALLATKAQRHSPLRDIKNQNNLFKQAVFAQRLRDQATARAQQFQRSERIEGQEFESEQSNLDRVSRKVIAGLKDNNILNQIMRKATEQGLDSLNLEERLLFEFRALKTEPVQRMLFNFDTPSAGASAGDLGSAIQESIGSVQQGEVLALRDGDLVSMSKDEIRSTDIILTQGSEPTQTKSPEPVQQPSVTPTMSPSSSRRTSRGSRSVKKESEPFTGKVVGPGDKSVRGRNVGTGVGVSDKEGIASRLLNPKNARDRMNLRRRKNAAKKNNKILVIRDGKVIEIASKDVRNTDKRP